MDQPSMNCRVLLVDDHNLVRVALRGLLERMSGIEVVGEADDGSKAIEQTSFLKPDVVLMDVTMPKMNGLEALTRIKQQSPDMRVMILSMHDGQDTVMRALRSGACGYLLKDAEVMELELALRAVMRGERYLSPQVSKQVLERLLEPAAEPPEPDGKCGLLTGRQTEILKLIAQGKPAKEIAFDLNLSVKTVESHRAQIMRRLGVHDVAGLVLYAVRQGLVSLDGPAYGV